MSNVVYMDAHFERNKNLKASAITLIICGGLMLLFIVKEWALPQIPPPIADEGFEVNLGTSETGLGNEQPLISGEPAPTLAAAVAASQPASSAEEKEQPTNDNEASPIATSATSKPIKKPEKENPTPVKKPATIPTPPAPKPKAQMHTLPGGNGTGGNNSNDSYNKTLNQGIAGGKGDQGNINGNPNSDSYKGNSPSGHGSGVTIRSGLNGRKILPFPAFTDDFNENAKVAVDITVDVNGNVTAQSLNLTGTTTTNQNIRSIALRKAKELKLNKGTEEQTGTIVFNFKVTN
jgi:hypothetical protein